MTNIKCSTCGLTNFAEAVICKRCGEALLSPRQAQYRERAGATAIPAAEVPTQKLSSFQLLGRVIGIIIILVGGWGLYYDHAQKMASDRVNNVFNEQPGMDQARVALQVKIKDALSRHEVMIGMTTTQVEQSWKRPRHVNTTETTRSFQEQWVYEDRGYLYFENGILTSIQRRH